MSSLNRVTTHSSLALISLALLSGGASATGGTDDQGDETCELKDALTNGRTWLGFRYRFEHVDDDGVVNEADASTLRTVLGYETGVWRGWSAGIEFEDVSPLGSENYNSTISAPSGGAHAVVADPDGTEVNQFWLAYGGFDDVTLRLGRREITFDNHRFIGHVGWRQNHQSFESFQATATNLGPVTANYAYLFGIDRIFGDNHPAGDEETSSHLLNVNIDLEDAGTITVYDYLLDFDDALMGVSTNTLGLRYNGKTPVGDSVAIDYTAEIATQSDAGDNPNDVDQEYFLAQVGGSFEGFRVFVAMEHLGGSGTVGDKFTTPLATLHAHNGFADQFLVTPDDGLEDLFFGVSGKVGKVKGSVTFHVFESDTGGRDYGDELDVALTMPLCGSSTLGVKYAGFSGDDPLYDDVTKTMAWISYSPL